MIRGLILLAALLGASAVFGLSIADGLGHPVTPEAVEAELAAIPAPAAGTAPLPAIPDMPAYRAPDFATYAEAVERPLFSPDRRPPSVAAPTPVVRADTALTATLRGVLVAESGSVALLTAVGDSTPVRVSQGQVFQGWTLQTINPDNVVFAKDGEEVTLELIYRASEGAGAQPKSNRP